MEFTIENPNQMVAVAEISQNSEKSVDEYAREFLSLKSQIGGLSRDLSENLETNENQIAIKKLKKEIEALKDKIENDPEISNLREGIKDLKERKNLVGEILVVKIKEQQLALIDGESYKVEIDGHEFIITDKLKVKKSQK